MGSLFTIHTASSWSIGDFLSNATTRVEFWGGAVLVLLGAIAIVVGVIKAIIGLMSHGKGQPTSWLVIILLIIVGGAVFAGGWDLASSVAEIGVGTIDELGQTWLAGFF